MTKQEKGKTLHRTLKITTPTQPVVNSEGETIQWQNEKRQNTTQKTEEHEPN